MSLSKIPTGIESLDNVLSGGLPAGSLVMLHGEIGAGDFEFAISTAARLLTMPEAQEKDITIPRRICYISLTRSKEDMMKEVKFSFPEFFEILENGMKQNRVDFKDLSESYFAMSFIPLTWISQSNKAMSFKSLKWNVEKANLVEALIGYLDKNADVSLVIIDSLTALAQYCLDRMEWKDLIMFLRGIQRASKTWNGIVYAMHTKGIFDKRHQEEIEDCMDGVIVFEWEKLGLTMRQRIMYLKKFRGVLPVLDRDNIVNFETQISPQRGFDILNIKRVKGR